jgi:hypothetical protein
MTENIFDKIKNKYKSSKHPVYWDVYKHVFSGFDLTQEVNIIEIGVDKGDGMLQFKELLPNCNICGLDIRKDTPNSPVGNVWIGSQTDIELLNKINEDEGPFDIVIDDGSHINDHQITTFEHLFPKLNPGGIYIIEDMHTSYWESCGGGYGKESFVNYCKKLTDLINYESWMRGFQSPSNYQWVVNKDDVEKYNAYNISKEIYKNINCISFYPNIIVIYKSNKESEYQFNCI